MTVQEQVEYVYNNYTISYKGKSDKGYYDSCIQFNAKNKQLKYNAMEIRWIQLSRFDCSIYSAELLFIGKNPKDNICSVKIAVTQDIPDDYYYDIEDNARTLLTSLLLLNVNKVDFVQ